jgi:hypothetical protein
MAAKLPPTTEFHYRNTLSLSGSVHAKTGIVEPKSRAHCPGQPVTASGQTGECIS